MPALTPRIRASAPLDSHRRRWPAIELLLAASALALTSLAGCQRDSAATSAKSPAPAPPDVAYVCPVEREYTDAEEFLGRLEASEHVEIRSRVNGYLDKILFQDGTDVEKGQLLAVIDPRTYEAEFARSTAGVRQAQARLQRLARQLERGRQLIATRVISQDEFDIIESDYAEAEAALQLSEATQRLAQLNLDFASIHAPVRGKISRRLVDSGNLIKADDTLLAVIGTVDPMYAYFEIDERTVLKLRQLILKGELSLSLDQHLAVEIALADESAYSLRGTIDFTDTSLDPKTGTLRLRALIDNHDLLLLPGLIVRCRMPIGKPRSGLFVPEESLGSDQGQRFLFALNEQDEVTYRRVRVGQKLDRWRLVEGELTASDRVLVAGLQRVKSGQKVAPKIAAEFAMPSTADAATAEALPADDRQGAADGVNGLSAKSRLSDKGTLSDKDGLSGTGALNGATGQGGDAPAPRRPGEG